MAHVINRVIPIICCALLLRLPGNPQLSLEPVCSEIVTGTAMQPCVGSAFSTTCAEGLVSGPQRIRWCSVSKESLLLSFLCFSFLSCRGWMNTPRLKNCCMEKRVLRLRNVTGVCHSICSFWVVYAISWFLLFLFNKWLNVFDGMFCIKQCRKIKNLND